MEAMFVRVNSALLNQGVPMAAKAVKYSDWMADIAAAAEGKEHNLTARVSGRRYLPRIIMSCCTPRRQELLGNNA